MADKPNTTTEEWRPIPNWEGYYEASSLGRIRSLDRTIRRRTRWGMGEFAHRGGILAPRRRYNGYYGVCLCRDGKVSTYSVHVLVCAAFHGLRPEGHQAGHRDGDRQNNKPENLRWVSNSENARDKIRHGTVAAGEKNGSSKLTYEKVEFIRSLKGVSQAKIGRLFDISQSQVGAILSGKVWALPADHSRNAGRNIEGPRHRRTVRYETVRRQGGLCAYCSTKLGKYFHMDHVVPLSRGGADHPDNMVAACPDCNLKKGNQV